MNEETTEDYLAAGRLAAKVIRKGAARISPGASLLEVVECTEAMVTDEGAALAFPLNISSNEDAAHDTASPGDERTFSKHDLVKIDLGIQVNGYIADTAMTVDLGKNDLLMEASMAALESAIAMIRPGITAGEVGAAVQQEIERRGYRPVANLTGHGLAQYNLHAPPSIPNIAVSGGAVIEEGMVIAIEPFATTGTGHVSERSRVEIFQQLVVKPVRMKSARQVMETSRKAHGLPFARRWIRSDKADIALRSLVRSNILRPFPVLHDVEGSLVSQHEHTVIVTGDGCIVTTR